MRCARTVVLWFLATAIAALLAGNPAAAQSSADYCLAPGEVADADISALADDLAVAVESPALCISERRVEENGAVWRLTIIRNTERAGPLWVLPHDDEDAAFPSGIYAVATYGGVMVAVENEGARYVDGLDPNRVFAVTDIAAEICSGAREPMPLYVGAVMADWNPDHPVIGLHTNWDGYLDGGGLGTISVLRLDDKMIPFPSEVAENRFADEDTIAMLVGLRRPSENSDARAAIDWLTGSGVHVIYRHVTPENNGCTLADYLTLDRIGPYFNLEVEHGDTATQPVLVDRLMEFLGSSAYRGML